MTLTPRHKLLIGSGALVLLIAIVFLTRGIWNAPPDNTTYQDSGFSFVYPRVNTLNEYARSAVGVGSTADNGFSPLVEVIRYQSDPDVALPESFDEFVRRQATALCGSDGPIENLTCSDVVSVPYTSAQGLMGEELSLTLLRTNLQTGTTSTEAFAPLYVFNTTLPVEDAEDTLRYRALFVYPSFASVVGGTTNPELLAQIIDSLLIPDGVSSVVGR